MAAAHETRRDLFLPALLGAYCALLAVVPGNAAKLAMLGGLFSMALIWWCAILTGRWLEPFFACLLLTPPMPGPVGDSGFHLAPVFALTGVLACLPRMREWNPKVSVPAAAFGLFVAILSGSVALAALYSGPDIAMGSLLRVLLFGIGVFVFLYASAGPDPTPGRELGLARLLFLFACAAALFACADFYFQFPAPAGFGAQYVWLDEGVLRRAQGLFYEASTLGNFCAFFLVMIAAALFRPRQESPCSKALLLGGGALLAAALILSYSRASLVSVLVALVALAFVRRVRAGRTLLMSGIVAVVAGLAVSFALPSFSASYWTRISGTLQYFWYSPNGVLSGRLSNWENLGGFLLREPWHALLGVGYKTLPYSNFTGSPVIADNTYISLLVETGVVGLLAFLFLNAAILKYSFRAARAPDSSRAFFGEWIFCFWTGEMVQMLSGDLITYWRVLPVCFWVLGRAVREGGVPR